MAKVKIYQDPTNKYQKKVGEGFNWWVVIFGPLWYFFNGMYLWGLGWVFFSCIIGNYAGLVGSMLVWGYAATRAYRDQERKYLAGGWKFVGYEDEIVQNNNVS
ncbi:MAG: hypothetical protein PWP31_1582 [Clostridia bacterium]|nr:hypothetical protein [Clostridia bacterium]